MSRLPEETTMADMITTELFVCVDDEGNVWADSDEGELSATVNDNSGGLYRRTVKIILKLPRPCPIEATISLPPDSNLADASVVEA
jgi:hypothetical protein